MAPFGKPPVQVYADAPPAVKLAVEPAQIAGEFTVTFGKAFTVTVAIAEFVQPLASVPVTV